MEVDTKPERPPDAKPAAPPADPLGWREHEPFVRALLRRLVADRDLVDDLAQETWLAAARHSAASIFLKRAWLGTVARNFALQSLRGRQRRLTREAAVARPIAEGGGDALIDAEPEQRRRLLSIVAALPEPYATVLRLRFCDDLPPTLIAERLALPVETVRTRLKRALAQVRAQLQQPRS